jgi:methyltransferase (TIGR00027 family)
MKTENIQHVSDTAHWIAAFRALETDRPDAVFKDHLAKKLAGETGFEMVETTPNKEAMAFAMVARTTAIDRLVESAITQGVDTVINLGAGLDTRPYRMKLPADLHWVEVDFQKSINFKNNLLLSDNPVCRLTRIGADLSVDDERTRVFQKLNAETKQALIITEGVVAYLTKEQAEKLSTSIHSFPNFHFWIMDYTQGKLRTNSYLKSLKKKLVHAPLQFNEKDPIQFFSRQGWRLAENIFILDEADRIKRKLPLKFPLTILMRLFPKTIRSLGNRTYGYAMFRHD